MQSHGPGVPAGTDAIPPPPTAYEAEAETAEPQVHLPPLSVWPITAAAGVTVAAAGLLTSPIIGFIGLIVMIIAIASWIQELRHERHQHH
jgi:hypothetical protein